MLKNITVCLSLILIVGCDTNLTHNRSFKWAVINQGTIQTKVTENFKKTDPFYKENANHEENQRNLGLITQQISELTQAAAQKCALDIAKTDKNKPSEPSRTEPSTPTAPSQMAGTPAFEKRYAMPLYGDESYNIRMSDSKLMQNPAYQECLSNTRKDQLFIDLKDKKKKIENMYSATAQHDNNIRKKINEEINLAIAKYAETNGYQLMIGNSPQYIIYNHDKVVLDVTDDVIDYILKNKIDVKLDNQQPVK